MTDHLTEDEVLAAVPGLTRARLVIFVQTAMVMPLRQDNEGTSTLAFSQIDCARIRLLCDLTDDLNLDISALGVVVSLIDQIHARRQDLLVLARAVAAEPAEVRARIGAALLALRA